MVLFSVLMVKNCVGLELSKIKKENKNNFYRINCAWKRCKMCAISSSRCGENNKTPTQIIIYLYI